MQSIGAIDSHASFVPATSGGNWSYTLPPTTSYNFTFTPTILNQIKQDNLKAYNDIQQIIQTQGISAAVAKYQTLINNAAGWAQKIRGPEAYS